MLFNFLKYLQPISYFSLKNNKHHFIFPDSSILPNEILEELDMDTNFKSDEASNLDLSWQAIQLGYIGESKRLTSISEIPLEDEYRFVRKYFNSIWASYCLILRVLSFNNPINEFNAWLQTRNTIRINVAYRVFEYKDWFSYDSELLRGNPKISVIIPTLNRYEYLTKVLQDFEKQDYTNFEIIIVDQSDHFNPAFYEKFNLDIQLIRQEEKALWLARNSAIKKVLGEIIALSEDDVRIKPDWLTTHIKCLDFFKADISAGVFYPEGSTIPKERSFFAISKQFATGNAMLYKDVFKKVGLFDRQFEKGRMGDGAFGLRCYLAGCKSVSNPIASCIDVKANTGGLRELGSWDAFRPTNWFAPRPVPSVLYYYRMYFGAKLALYGLLKAVPPSIIPYKFKRNKKMMILGIMLSVVVAPIILLQVLRSWHIASIKLKDGSKIEKL
jgi:glycosyltransferase involved in cell wall biosynthesis